MFWLNWLIMWENAYPNRFIPDNNHKFSSLKQLKPILYFTFQKTFNFQNAMHKYLKHNSIHFVHVRTKLFFKKYTQKWNYNRTTNCP